VASAGDVNGDGRADLVVAADGADHRQRRDAGATYVVLGKSSMEAVDLTALGTGGFAVDGAGAGDNAGLSIAVGRAAAAGRVDLVVGAPRADNNARVDSGSVYVASFDGRAPSLRLGTQSPQRVVSRRRVVVRATCGEACELVARGAIVMRVSRRIVRLAPASARLAGAGSRTLTLRLTARQVRRLAEALELGVRARARITVRAVDVAGNAATSTRTIAVRR
jgi:hypothetical protein